MTGSLSDLYKPTGPEHGSLRRMPWVSISIMALISLIYLFYSFVSPDLAPVIKAMNYRAARPYLNAPSIYDQLIENNPSFVLTNRRSRPKDPPLVDLEQKEMDILADRGLAALENLPIRRWSYAPGELDIFGLFTHIFYHQAMYHVALNFLFFVLCGPFMEDRWGRVFFPIFFVSGGVASALGLSLMFPGSGVLLYGASGSVAAVTGAYMVRYRHVKMRLMTSPSLWFSKAIEISPLWIVPTWFVGEVIYMYLMRDVFGSGYIVVWSHVWGFVFGVIVALAVKYYDLEKEFYADEYDRLPEDLRCEADIERYLKHNEREKALKLLASASTKFPDHWRFQERYWDQAFRMGRGREALAVGKKLIQKYLDDQNYGRAYFHWQSIIEAVPGENIAIPLVNRLIHGLLTNESGDNAKHVARHTVEKLPHGLKDEALIQFVETASFADPGLALRAITLLDQRDPSSGLRAQLSELEKEIRIRFPKAGREPEVEITPSSEVGHVFDQDPFAPTRIKSLKIHTGVPTSLTERGLMIKRDNRELILPYHNIKALSLGAIREIGGKPYLLLDILLDDPAGERPSHGLLRFSSTSFDPRSLTPGTEKPGGALRSLVVRLLEKSEAVPLPDMETLIGEGFPRYGSVAEYEKAVYGVA